MTPKARLDVVDDIVSAVIDYMGTGSDVRGSLIEVVDAAIADACDGELK
jgi:isocitrate dehydrogenase